MAGKSYSPEEEKQMLLGTPLQRSALMRRIRREQAPAPPEETTVYGPGGAVFRILHRAPGSPGKILDAIGAASPTRPSGNTTP